MLILSFFWRGRTSTLRLQAERRRRGRVEERIRGRDFALWSKRDKGVKSKSFSAMVRGLFFERALSECTVNLL